MENDQIIKILVQLKNHPKLEQIWNQISEASSKVQIEKEDEIRLNQFLENLNNQFQIPEKKNIKKVKRLYVDGCFDLMHSGHFNALRQCKMLCETLVCGVVGDQEMIAAKGPNIMDLEERCALAKACKWVDEVQPDVPYTPSLETLDQFNCSHVAHGDDIAIGADGKDCYHLIRQQDRLLIVKRTEGISTTDIVGRLLMLSTQHIHNNPQDMIKNIDNNQPLQASKIHEQNFKMDKEIQACQLFNTTRRIRQFCNNKEAKPDDVVVYVSGDFDVLHKGHLEFLEKASKLGTFLILGLHDDQLVKAYKGHGFPVLNYHERTLNVLALRYVDEVIIGAPWKVNERMINQFKIQIVAKTNQKEKFVLQMEDPYELPKQKNMLQEINCDIHKTTEQIIQKIYQNRQSYLDNQQVKEAKLKKYYEENNSKKQEVIEI